MGSNDQETEEDRLLAEVFYFYVKYKIYIQYSKIFHHK